MASISISASASASASASVSASELKCAPPVSPALSSGVSSGLSSVSSVSKSKSSVCNNNISVDLDERKIAETVLKAADDKLQSLCVAHAATFVAVERRGSELSSSLQKLISTLDSSVESVSTSKRCLETAADERKESTLTTLAEKHRLRRRTLLQHSSLLELLELPNLMDACVRGHLYEEALSIASFANTLERRHLHLLSGSGSTHIDINSHSQHSQHASNIHTNNINNINSSNNNTQTQHKHKHTHKHTLTHTHTLTNQEHSSFNPECNPVVANVVNEVRKRELDLRRHLLHRLRSDVTMPQCLEVVTALRRLNSVDLERSSLGNAAKTIDLEKVHEAMERRLQVDFLEARDVWLDATATTTLPTPAISTTANTSMTVAKTSISLAAGKSEQLLDSIDIYRTRCFEITTQFLAIFRTSSQQSTTSISLPKSATAPDHALQLLSIWTTRRIHYFIHTVLSKNRLAMISDATTLRDALDSANFFATSMGRIGADFSPLLPAVFEPALLSIVTSYWVDGVNALKETLKVCRDAGIASPLHSTSGTTTASTVQYDAADNEHHSGTDNHHQPHARGTISHQSKTPSPPRQLLSLPPLARLVNAFLVGLNELRRCLLPNTFPKLRTFFKQEFVTRVHEICHQNERVVLTPGFLNQKGEEAGKLRTLAVELKETFEGCVEPYLNGALEVAIGVFEIEKVDVCEEEKEEEKEEEEKEEETEEGTEEGTVESELDTPKNDKGNDTLLNDVKETEDEETKDNDEGTMPTQEDNGGTESEEVKDD